MDWGPKGCGSVGSSLAQHAQGHGFKPQNHISQLGSCRSLLAALNRWRQEVLGLEVILGYLVNLRPTWTT